jgi:hypothetical protein
MEKMFNTVNYWGISNKNTMTYHLSPVRIDIVKDKNRKHLTRMYRKWSLCYLRVRMQTSTFIMENYTADPL